MAELTRRANAKICNNNRLEGSDVTAPEDVSFPFSNSYDLVNRNKVYKPGTNTFLIEIDLKSNQKNVSFFSILGESNEQLKISDDAIITIRANSIDFFDGSEPINEIVPVGELGIYKDLTTSDDDETYGVNYRYWQIEVDDSLNPDEVVIAYIYLGDSVILHRNISNGFRYDDGDNTQVSRSDNGKTFTRQRPEQTRISAVSMQIMSYEDKNNLLRCVRRIGRHTPFLFVLDPLECREDFDFGTRPMYFDNIPIFSQVVRNRYTTQWTMREVI